MKLQCEKKTTVNHEDEAVCINNKDSLKIMEHMEEKDSCNRRVSRMKKESANHMEEAEKKDNSMEQ